MRCRACFTTTFPTYAVGLNFTLPIRNRAAQADSARALLSERSRAGFVPAIAEYRGGERPQCADCAAAGSRAGGCGDQGRRACEADAGRRAEEISAWAHPPVTTSSCVRATSPPRKETNCARALIWWKRSSITIQALGRTLIPLIASRSLMLRTEIFSTRRIFPARLRMCRLFAPANPATRGIRAILISPCALVMLRGGAQLRPLRSRPASRPFRSVGMPLIRRTHPGDFDH